MINALSYDDCQEIILSRYPGALYIVIDAPDHFISSNGAPFICGFIAIVGTPHICHPINYMGTPPSISPVYADYCELLSICY